MNKKKETEVTKKLENNALAVYNQLVSSTLGMMLHFTPALLDMPEDKILGFLKILESYYDSTSRVRQKKVIIDIIENFNLSRSFELFRQLRAKEKDVQIQAYIDKALDNMLERRR